MKSKIKQSILVVDDDVAHRDILKKLISAWGYDVTEADDGSTAIDQVKQRAFDLILMDIRMQHVSGIDALAQIKIINPAIPVIIMTAYESVETVKNSWKKGAYDYLTKPLDFDKLKINIVHATEHIQLKKENEYLKTRLGEQFDRRNMIGQSPAMAKLLDTVSQVAATEATILISGEAVTGTEMIANAVHYNSRRQDAPFIKINCAALTETLLETELFGHEKGSFTGADLRREGKFRQAEGGSIFLDEVSEMSPAMQVKLLRVLQEREITRVGGSEVIKINVRVIAASNKDLKKEMEEKRFREDLFYRLNVVALPVPPLRERKEDIPLLAQHFLQLFSTQNGKRIKGFTPQAMEKLSKYSWPGNIRELMNAVERAVVLSHAEYLDADELALLMGDNSTAGNAAQGGKETNIAGPAENLPLEQVEKRSILEALTACGGNKSEAARRLGITRKTLRKKLEKYENTDS